MRIVTKIIAVLVTTSALAFGYSQNEQLNSRSRLQPKSHHITPKPKIRLLRDGVVLAGVDVHLENDAARDIWTLTFASQVSDDKVTLRPSDAVQILPSATLQRMIGSLKHADSGDFRIWGTVTQFDGKNYVYPAYYLAIRKEPNTPAAAAPEPNEPNSAPIAATNEPNDTVVIPEDVLKMLKPKRTVDLAQIAAPGPELEPDALFAERSGFIRADEHGKWYFKPDAIGRSVGNVSFTVLPNADLARAINEQTGAIERVRFKASGILTAYNGQYYILLQRVVRQYSHENFGR